MPTNQEGFMQFVNMIKSGNPKQNMLNILRERAQGNPMFALAGRYPNVYNERFFSYSSDTGITFTDARAYNNTTIQNSYAIPIKISGIN